MNPVNMLQAFSIMVSLAAAPALAGGNCGLDGEAKSGSALEQTEIKTQAANSEAAFPVIGRDALLSAVTDKSVFIVDANSPESFAKGHIPGAVNFETAGEKFAGLLPKDKAAKIVAYCGGPGCHAWSGAAEKMKQLGYSNVHHFKGGIKDWKTAGLTLEKSPQG